MLKHKTLAYVKPGHLSIWLSTYLFSLVAAFPGYRQEFFSALSGDSGDWLNLHVLQTMFIANKMFLSYY